MAPTPSHTPLTPRARGYLAAGLDALDAHTEAPLRVRGHASALRHEVFEIEEEFEIGPRGRRFFISVGADLRETVLFPAADARAW